jgi:light-regulated signal transduction histidine kinase (bacteriophytochrome)
VPSPTESDLSAVVIEHLADIAAGRCTITDQQIDEAAQTDPLLAEILTGLLFLHEDLALRAAQRDRALAEAEAANRELEAFSYSVAHDLRAPLTTIDGFSRLLERYADRLDDKGREYPRYIRESAQRMAQLIDNLLKLSQVARGALRRTTVDLSSLARDVLARLRRDDPDRRVEAVVDDGLVCVGDPGLLAVVLANLLGNAWKFTGKRKVARIEFRAQAANRPIVYLVRDNGVGFDMADAPKLFGVFQRLHSAHEFEGTGIGLATVQRIVRRHGGRVWAEGEVDRGATVYFTLEEEDQK